MSAIAAKWISSFVLFGATLVVSILPVIVFNYFTKIKKKKRNQYNINNTFNISSPLSSSNQRTTTNINNLSSNIDDNESVTGSGENVIRRTRSNSITSISSISSRKLNKKSAKILQIFMFFGGGVLLATSFCHLIPEIKENFEKYQHRDHNHNHSAKNRLLKPFSSDYSDELNTDLTSIETTTLPDVLLFNKRNLTDLPLPSSLHAHPHSHEEEIHEIDATTPNTNDDDEETNESNTYAHKHDNLPWVEIAICGGFFFIYLLEELIHTFVHNHSHGLDEKHNNTFKSETIDDINWELPYQSKTDSDTNLVNNSTNKSLPCYDNYAIDFNSEPQLVSEQIATRKSIEQDENSIRNRINQNAIATSEDKQKLLPASVRFVQGLVIIGAFSAHSIFDGLAIGLQSSTTQIYTMLFAISMHKLVVAFAVGLELYDQTCSVYMTSILMSLFSVMSPIGVWIVIFSQKTTGIVSEDQSLLLIMLNAVACGTIIYIVFFEILQKDRSGSHVNGVLLWVVMFSGFMLMLSVNIFVVG